MAPYPTFMCQSQFTVYDQTNIVWSLREAQKYMRANLDKADIIFISQLLLEYTASLILYSTSVS